MSDVGLPEDEERLGIGGGLGGRRIAVIAIAALAVVGAVYYFFYLRPPGGPEAPKTGQVAEVPQGSRTVTLYFAGENDAVLVNETRQVAIGHDLVEQVEQVMRALIAGPEREGVSAIPKGTKLLDVFYAADTFTIYLDFSGEFIAEHPGGSTAEYFTVSALMKTISSNFPEVQAVQLLCEGSQVSTIAGHINAYKPLYIRDWR